MWKMLPLLRVAAALGCVMPIVSQCAAEDLSLSQAVEKALANNPTIAAGELSAEAARRSVRGASALVNPEMLVAPTVAGEGGSDSALLLTQPLEINSARKIRGLIAQSESRAADSNAQVLKRDLILEVKDAYWEVIRSRKIVELNQDNLDYLDDIHAAVRKQYDTGTIPGLQVVKSQVEIARARQELAQAQLELNQAEALLDTLMNVPGKPDFTAADPLVFSAIDLDPQVFHQYALNNRPELAAARWELSAAQSRTKAARLLAAPDIAIQARKESFSPNSDAGVSIAVTFPVLDWGSAKAQRQSAESAAQASGKHLDAAINKVKLDVELAIMRVRAADAIVCEYENGILEKSEQLADMARKGYEKGATSYLEVLEAQRTLRSTRTDYYTALATHAKALAQLEWATGCNPAQLKSPEEKK